MKIIVVGLNHKTASVDVREKLAFSGSRLEEGLLKIRELPEIDEVVVLSPCNRVEVYAAVKDFGKSFETISMFLSEFHGLDKDALKKSLYLLNDSDAFRHVFRVASSLDSLVVGEPQILGQLKDAFDCALRGKTTGIFLN